LGYLACNYNAHLQVRAKLHFSKNNRQEEVGGRWLGFIPKAISLIQEN
jgi:hypothetical protein